MKETTKQDKTEFDDLDLALPEDLEMDFDSSPGSSDDLDLELPELTLDDDTPTMETVDASPVDMDMDLSAGNDFETSSAADLSGSIDSEDEEPIALSEEELEKIVGDSGTEMFEDPSDEPSAGEHSPYADSHSDDFDSHDEDLNTHTGHDMELEMDSTISGMDPHSHTTDMDLDSTIEEPSMSSDLDDEGPLALSEEELGNIMGDVSHETDFSMVDAEPDSSAEMDMGAAAGMEPPDSPGDDEDETITLSDDELNNILLDSSEGSGEEPSSPPLSQLGLDEDDEPIALTPEELGNIISDVDEEAAPSDMEFGHQDDDGMEAAAPGLLDDEDEGPVALSDSELDSILEDVQEEPVEIEPETPRDSANLIVLDEYEDKEGTEVKAHARAAQLDAIASDEGVNKQELKKMISYLDQLFDRLPEDTVREFSRSEYFDLYRKIMDDLGLS